MEPPRKSRKLESRSSASSTTEANGTDLQAQIRTCIREEVPDLVKSIIIELGRGQNTVTSQTPPTTQMADTEKSTETPASQTMALAGIIQEPATTNTGTNLQHSIARPLSTGIDAKIKAKIWANEYVEFKSLMSTKQKEQNHLTLVEQDGSVSFVKAKSNNFKFNSINQWNNAFHIYVAIYCEKHPMQSTKLMKYAATISTLASQATLQAAMGYDKAFREWRESDPESLPWDQVNTELYQQAFGMAFLQKTSPSSQKNGEKYNNNLRPNKAPAGSYCFEFNNNGGKCTRRGCIYPHVCQTCRGAHHRGTCKFQNKNPTSSANSQTTSTENKKTTNSK